MKRKFISPLLLTGGLLISLVSNPAKAQEPCRGVLTVNEISNGINGSKEFVELLAANCGECSELEARVDISNWIIDDNNGIFTPDPAVASSNLGISAGHLKLTNDSLWTNFSNGTLLVLFNNQDFDSTNSDFMNASTQDFYVSPSTGAIFVAVGFSSLVEVKTNTPIVGVSSSAEYCNASAYALSATSWNSIGLRNSKLGDGIQVRCPGCNPDDPEFYHGVSYGDTTMHVTNANPLFFDGAHIAFDALDSIGGTGRSFIFFQGSDPGVDSNWTFIDAASATPGAGNTLDNLTYLDDVALRLHEFNCCALIEEPVDSVTDGVLIVTELSNGPSGSCEYVELLVASCNSERIDSVDIRGWIIDDNSGNFNTTGGCTSGVGISTGHLRFVENSCWEKVPVGAVIVLFNSANNCYNFVDDACDSNNDGIYYISVGTNTNIEVTTSRPSSSNCDYCPSTYSSPISTSWGTTVALGNTKDAMQVRCPGCTDENPAEPAFYHGMGYGSGFGAITAGSDDLGGAYVSGTGSAKKYEFFQGSDPGLNANWQSSAADAAGTPPASAGTVFAFRDSVIAGVYNLPCCAEPIAFKSQGTALGVTTISDRTELVVYPNPANDMVNFKMTMDTPFEIQILDLTGKIVYSSTYAATQGVTTTQVNVSGIASGTYTYIIKSTETAETQSGIVVIERN